MKHQFKKESLVAVMELHTFSSLNKEFLEQYEGSINDADIPVVFLYKDTFAHKKLPMMDESFVKDSFNNQHLNIFTDKESLQNFLLKQDWNAKNLLLMSSGNFAGMNLEEVSNKILNLL